MVYATWQDKVHARIAALCLASYLKANTRKDGKRYARHVPYSVPEEAQALVECLGKDDEERAKSIMLYGLIGRMD